jgi:S-adenosylmethionine decarboxylase
MGKHYLLNLYGCDPLLLNDMDFVVKMLSDAALFCNATILNVASHKFEPCGLTVVLMLAESHISMHTWPDRHTAACDVYTCSKTDPKIGCDFIIEKLRPIKNDLIFIQR